MSKRGLALARNERCLSPFLGSAFALKSSTTRALHVNKQAYSFEVIGGLKLVDSTRHNVDVEVHFEDGSRFVATFFTLRNIHFLFDKNQGTGECVAGLYFWASDMILVTDYSIEIFTATIDDLLTDGAFSRAFSRLDP